MRFRTAFRSWRWGCLVLAVASALALSARAEPPKKVDFAHDIVPILKARCAECHTNGKYKGSLSLDTREAILQKKAAVAGKSGDSEIVRRITSTDADERMPSKGPPLLPREVDLLRAWIDQGLPWEEGFTFKTGTYVAPLRPRRPKLPGDEEAHPIDRLLAPYYSQHRLAVPTPVDDATFVRRVYLDLVGLLPAPTEADAFIADTAPDKRQRLARRLLDEKRAYADHWLTFWNDLLRNDYAGPGYVDKGRKQITPWLYGALLENKPYDAFVRELISPTTESEGFILGIKWRGNVNASQVPELQFAQNVAQVFFGVNLKCASCHDSFIDHWKLDEAYSLAAVIADKPLEIFRCDKATGRTASPRFLFPELGDIDAAQPKAKRLEQLARLVTHPDNGRFTRTIANRLWQRLLGRGLVHPVDVMANRPWSEDVLDYLAIHLAKEHYDLKKLIEHIVTSRAYQAQAVPMAKEPSTAEYVFRGPELKRLTAEEFMDAVWMLTRTGPAKIVAPVRLPEYAAAVPPERRLMRAALVNADGLMRSLGRPNREQVVTTRPDQLTTLQALDLSNGQILADTLAKGAANLLKEKSNLSAEERVEEIYRRALCRRPTVQELEAARELLGTPATAEGLADLLWAVIMLPEFQLVR